MKNKIKQYIEYESIVNNNKGTISYNNTIAKYLFNFFDDNESFIDTKDLVLYYKKTTNLSNKTINKCIKFLRQVYDHHNIENIDLFSFKLLKEKHVRRDVISESNLKKIFKYVNGMSNRGNAEIYKVMTYMLYDTGVRPNELLNIKIENIDLNNRLILLETTKTGIPRYVFISLSMKKMLKKFLKTYDNDIYLFYNNLRNRKMTTSDLKNFWRRVKNATGIKTLNTYMFRHTYITDLINLNTPLAIVQQQAGHAKINTTMIYYHSSTRLQAKYLNKVKRKIY